MMYDDEEELAVDHGGVVVAATDYEEPAPNLEVIYQAFGEQADLYKDVLQVKSSATAEQIQMAYFDRRSELFALLASIDSEEEQDDITASHRFHAERKMDAVVMAVRILGDPQLRQEYDNVVLLRQTKKQPREPPSSSSGASRSSSTREPDGVYAGVGPQDDEIPRSPSNRSRSSPHHHKSPKRRSNKRRSRRHQHVVSPETSHDDIVVDDDAKFPPSTSFDEMAFQQQDFDPQLDYEFIRQTSSRSTSRSKSEKKKHKHKNKHRHKHHHESSSHDHTEGARQYEDTAAIHEETHHKAVTFGAIDEQEFLENDAYRDEATIETRTLDDQATIASQSTAGEWTRDSNRRLATSGVSTLSKISNSGFISRIQEEVAGTVEDTLVSFEQVLNVFTLQDREIEAVVGRIDKAKRQFQKGAR